MSSTREMRLRIRSVKNIAQVTRALETVSASKVRKAMQANAATEPYAQKAWKVLLHLASQPVHNTLHPLLVERPIIDRAVIVLISSDRGLAGAFNVNIVRKTLEFTQELNIPVDFITVGRKGRDMVVRRRNKVIAEFNDLPSPASFMDVSAVGRIIVDEFLSGHFGGVYLAYTHFINMAHQEPIIRKLLPMQFDASETEDKLHGVFTYEPDGAGLLDEIVPRFTAIQIYQSVLSSQASEHAARMIAMRNATDNARELISALQLEYNKIRQQIITNDMIDIAGGAEALAASKVMEA